MTLKEVVISQGLAIWSQAVLGKVVIISLDQTKKHEFNIRTFTPWHCLTTLVIIIVLPKRCNHFSGPKKWFNIRTFTPYHCRRVPKTTVFCQVLPHYRFQMIWTTPSYTAFYMAMLHRKTLLLWTDHFPHTDSLAAPWQPRLRHEVLKPVLVFLQRLLTSRTVSLSEADVGALAQQVVGRFHQWPRTGDL